MKMKRNTPLFSTVLALALGSSVASAATCDQLKATNVAVGGLVEKIKKGDVSPHDGLKAGIAELGKLELSPETKAKVNAKTVAVLAKGPGATVNDVLPLFAEAATDLNAEASTQKCK